MADGTNYLHPGVYIQELPGVPTVQSVATSIPVFIGFTEILNDSDRNVARKVTGWADYTARYGSFVFGANVSSAVFEFFAEGGALCYIIGINPTEKGNQNHATASIADPVATFKFAAASMGSWQKILQIAITDVGPIPSTKNASNYFNVNVIISNDDLIVQSQTLWTRLIGAYINSNAIVPIKMTINKVDKIYYILESFGTFAASSVLASADGAPCPLQAQINAKSVFVRVTSVVPNKPTVDTARTGPMVLAGGGPATLVSETLYTNAVPLLASIPDASLVATPDACVVDITKDLNATDLPDCKSIIELVAQKCAELQNLFYVIDAPYLDNSTTDNSQNIVDFVTGGQKGSALVYENAAFYYPWPVVMNPMSGNSIPVPPCGPVLGRYASNDLTVGVHASPAGVRTGRIQSATGMTRWLTATDQDALNLHGINAIRPIPGYGITIYGARTLAGPGQWQYVAVRRFVTFVEQSLKVSLEWVVFQPNSEFLWATVVREVTAFLTLLWHQGALFGAAADEAFFVTCDNTNNPPSLRTQGALNIDVGLAVLYPAEFVVIRLSQMTSGSGSAS